MNKNRQFEKQMRSFLTDIDNNKKIDYSNPATKHCVYECSKRNYVSGYRGIKTTIENEIIFDVSNPRVEKDGYEFLYLKSFLALEYIIKNIFVPIVVAVISTLITNFLFQIL